MADTNDKINDVARNYSFIKGRIAEAIAERMFISLGMIPTHNGYEIKNPDLAYLRRTGQLPKDAIHKIEYGCDFIVRSEQKNSDGFFDVYQIEIKYNKKGYITSETFSKYQDDKLIFILMDMNGFWCATWQEIQKLRKDKKTVKFSSLFKLENHPVFGFKGRDKNIIRKSEYFIHAILGESKSQSDVKNHMKSYDQAHSALGILFKGKL